MTNTIPHHQRHEIHAVRGSRRQSRTLQLILAGAAAVAMLALFDAAQPDTTQTVVGSGPVRLADMASTPPAGGPFGGFAADDDNDNDQAQQQEQLALQQMQQSEQQAQEQNDEAEQQFEQGMQQAQLDEQQANDP